MNRERFFLLIEDDESDIHIFKRAHKKLGLNRPVVVEQDAEKALALLLEHSGNRDPLVILDIKMPRMDGFEFLRRLRQLDEHRSNCIFVLSSSDSQTDIEQAYDLGASAYFVKTHSFDKTLAALKLMDQFIELAELPPQKRAPSSA